MRLTSRQGIPQLNRCPPVTLRLCQPPTGTLIKDVSGSHTGRDRRYVSDEQALDGQYRPAVAAIDAERCIGRLSDLERCVLRQAQEGRSHAETARSCGVSEGNSALILHRARKKLKECIEGRKEDK
ncbi:MAG: hypothetical protein FJW39_22605 [Acidobacteria bacterium]|nr:hypothetical protein [Acidobacteriota bacterium]